MHTTLGTPRRLLLREPYHLFKKTDRTRPPPSSRAIGLASKDSIGAVKFRGKERFPVLYKYDLRTERGCHDATRSTGGCRIIILGFSRYNVVTSADPLNGQEEMAPSKCVAIDEISPYKCKTEGGKRSPFERLGCTPLHFTHPNGDVVGGQSRKRRMPKLIYNMIQLLGKYIFCFLFVPSVGSARFHLPGAPQQSSYV